MSLYIKSLDSGTARTRTIAHIVASTALLLMLALPLVSVGVLLIG